MDDTTTRLGRGRARAVVRVGGAFAVVTLLAACSSDAGSGPAASTPDPRATLSSEARWADEVCHAAGAVSRSLTGLEAAAGAIPPEGTEPFAKTRGGLLTRIGSASGSTQSLVAVLERTPGSAGSAFGRTGAALDRSATRVRAAYVRLGESTEDIAAATTLAELRATVADTMPEIDASAAAASRFEDALADEATAGVSEVREAFAAAPSCATFVSGS